MTRLRMFLTLVAVLSATSFLGCNGEESGDQPSETQTASVLSDQESDDSPLEEQARSLPLEGASLYTVDDHIAIVDEISVNETGTLLWVFAQWIEFYWNGNTLSAERNDDSDLYRLVCLALTCEIGNSDALETDGLVLKGTVAVWRFDPATALRLEGYAATDFWTNADPELAQKAVDTGLNLFDDTPLFWSISSGNNVVAVVLAENGMLISDLTLHAALDRGSTATRLVTSLLASGANPNAVHDGLTALEKAVPSSTSQVASLLEHGAVVTHDSLRHAITRKDGGVVALELLLDSLQNNQLAQLTDGLLNLAIKEQNHHALGTLLEAGVSPVPGDLDNAVLQGTVLDVEKLLSYGAPSSASALQRAITRGKAEIVQLLLEHGIVPEARELQSALSTRNNEIISLLLTYGAPLPSNSLRGPIGRGDLALTEELLAAGAEILPEHLSLAIESEAPKIVELLVSTGVEIPTESVAFAVESGVSSTVELLLAAGGEATPQSLELAVTQDDYEIAALLVESGAAPSQIAVRSGVADASERLALLLLDGIEEAEPAAIGAALTRSNFSGEILRRLLGLGGDPNVPVLGTYPLLYVAAQQGNLEAVELAIEFGADVNLVGGYRNWTALHGLAFTRKPSVEVAEYLLAAGANVNARGVDGSTPCDIARANSTAGPLVNLLCDQ